MINNFIVKNGKINVGGSLLKVFGDKGMGIDMPDIHMKDIGKDKETSPAEAFSMILAEMTGGVSGSVTQFGKELQKQLGKAVEGAGKAVEDVTKGDSAVRNPWAAPSRGCSAPSSLSLYFIVYEQGRADFPARPFLHSCNHACLLPPPMQYRNKP